MRLRRSSKLVKSGLPIFIVGVILMLTAPFVGVTHVKPVRVLLKDSLTVEFEEVSVLSFRVDSARPGYLVRVFVNVTDVIIGGRRYRPILDVVVIDQEGLDMLERNQTVGYAYVRAAVVQDPILLTVKEIRKPGEYYVVFTNRFPVSARIPVIITDEWDEWNFNLMLNFLLATGLIFTFTGIFWRRVVKLVKGLCS
ncbi:MAG: hypothetical protein QXF26_07145 [Candidatus Bathyarchaeia archaeon]